MKCYECIHLKTDKLKPPCSECIGRPHDLCCGDNFEPIKDEPMTAEESYKAWNGLSFKSKMDKVKETYLTAFKAGATENEKKHRAKQNFEEWNKGSLFLSNKLFTAYEHRKLAWYANEKNRGFNEL